MNRINMLAVAVYAAAAIGNAFAGFAYPARTMESTELDKTVEYSLIVPMAYLRDASATFPVLFALHGGGSSYDAYISMQNIKDSVEAYPMLVVAFNASNSGYVEEADFLLGEFKDHIEATYRTDGQYAVTGFSMGGRGAFQYMVNNPDAFKAVSAKSGAFYSQDKSINTRLAAAGAAGTELPPIYMNCGTEDTWISNQREMKDTLLSLGYAYEYYETAGAGHDYDFWHATMAILIPWHGQYFDYTSGVTDRSAAVTSAAATVNVSPNPSYGSFAVDGFNGNNVAVMTPDGAYVGSVPVVNGTANWKAALPGLADGIYVIGSEYGAVRARVMLIR